MMIFYTTYGKAGPEKLLFLFQIGRIYFQNANSSRSEHICKFSTIPAIIEKKITSQSRKQFFLKFCFLRAHIPSPETPSRLKRNEVLHKIGPKYSSLFVIHLYAAGYLKEEGSKNEWLYFNFRGHFSFHNRKIHSFSQKAFFDLYYLQVVSSIVIQNRDAEVLGFVIFLLFFFVVSSTE